MKLTGLLLFVFSYISTRSQGRFDFSVPVQVEGRTTTLDIFKGKPMILEFFGAGCSVCFKEMPRVNRLSNEMTGRISFVLVGDDTVKLPETYKKFQRRYNLNMNVVFSPLLHKKFQPPYTPYYLWVDKTGNIVSGSGGEVVLDSLVEKFLKGDFGFLRRHNPVKNVEKKDLFVRKREEFYWRSGFSESIDSVSSSIFNSLKISEDQPYIQFVNCPLNILFKMAWFGQSSWDRNDPYYGEIWPSVELSDNVSESEISKLVCYSFSGNAFRTRYSLQRILQQDLDRAFGLTAHVYETEKPCWVIRRVDSGKVVQKTKYPPSQRYSHGRYDGYSCRSSSFSAFLSWIEYSTGNNIPLINRTDIKWDVDIEFSAIMTSWEDVVEALGKAGFSVVQESRPMRVLLISRSNNL